MNANPPRRLLTAALDAAKQGWPVFPLQPYGKRPAITAWPQRATNDPGQLAAWWERGPYNIGIACGPAALLVVDLDAGPGAAAGKAVFAQLAEEAGGKLERTFRTVTPSGGQHRYYTVTPGQPVRSTVGWLGSHVDTRGTGGYVVAAGSVRRRVGRLRYYTIADPTPPAPLPDWLAGLLRPASPTSILAAPIVMSAVYGRAALRAECALVRVAEPGTRNATLFRAALRLGSLVAVGAVDEGDAVVQLTAASTVHFGVSGFTAGEADRTITNGLRYGMRRPRGAAAG